MIEAFHNWKKSTRSGGANQCVECAAAGGRRAIRDSKVPQGSRLIVSASVFAGFVAGAKRGLFDLG